MLSFLEGIGDVIVSAVNYVIALIGDLIYTIGLGIEALAAIGNYFTWLPSGIVATIVVIFGVVFLYKVLGREG